MNYRDISCYTTRRIFLRIGLGIFFVGLELRFEGLGQSETTSSKGISKESTFKHESGGD